MSLSKQPLGLGRIQGWGLWADRWPHHARQIRRRQFQPLQVQVGDRDVY